MLSYHIGEKSRKILYRLISEELEYLESSKTALEIPDPEEDREIAELKELKEVFSGEE